MHELFAEQRPVRQIGEGVVTRHVRDLRLRLLPLRDVLEGGDPAAADHRLIYDPDRAAELPDDPGRAAARLRVGNELGEKLLGLAFPATEIPELAQDVDQEASLQLHARPS